MGPRAGGGARPAGAVLLHPGGQRCRTQFLPLPARYREWAAGGRDGHPAPAAPAVLGGASGAAHPFPFSLFSFPFPSSLILFLPSLLPTTGCPTLLQPLSAFARSSVARDTQVRWRAGERSICSNPSFLLVQLSASVCRAPRLAHSLESV